MSHDKLASSAALAERRLTNATSRLEQAEHRLQETNEHVADLEARIETASVAEPSSDGNSDENMKAMLAAKERIIDRAKERARQIEDDPQETARNIVAKAQDQVADAGAAEQPVQEPVAVASSESVVLAKKEAAVVLARAEQKAATIVADAKQIEIDARQAGVAGADLDELARGILEAARARADSITARAEAVAAEASQEGARLRDGAQIEADAIIERAWSEARRAIGHTDDDGTDDAAKLAELRAELEKQRSDFDKARIEHEQSQAQLELEWSDLAAERAAFDARIAQGDDDSNTTISDALSELEQELARLDAAAPEPIPHVADDTDERIEDPAGALGNWDMLWHGEPGDEEAPMDTEVIEEADDAPVVDAELSADDDVSEQDDEDAEPKTEPGDGSKYGESRYARKSSHLPRIESDSDSPSTGAGLRNAIIGVHNKRGGGSA
ncbi:MAG: hypothetical protein U9N84_11590 [Actinomycetota bacterium]|nr:hypothetical protein [Actinomycetota bacterium]